MAPQSSLAQSTFNYYSLEALVHTILLCLGQRSWECIEGVEGTWIACGLASDGISFKVKVFSLYLITIAWTQTKSSQWIPWEHGVKMSNDLVLDSHPSCGAAILKAHTKSSNGWMGSLQIVNGSNHGWSLFEEFGLDHSLILLTKKPHSVICLL